MNKQLAINQAKVLQEQLAKLQAIINAPDWEVERAAYNVGKTIQYRAKGSNRVWAHAGTMSERDWNDTDLEFRVKPWKMPTPPKGFKWCGVDWKEEYLLSGERPLLFGEKVMPGDFWIDSLSDVRRNSCVDCAHFSFIVTTRPLPLIHKRTITEVSLDGETWVVVL